MNKKVHFADKSTKILLKLFMHVNVVKILHEKTPCTALNFKSASVFYRVQICSQPNVSFDFKLLILPFKARNIHILDKEKILT